MSLGENKLDMQDFPIEIQNMILQHMEGLHNQAIVDEQRYQIFFQNDEHIHIVMDDEDEINTPNYN